MTQVLDKPTKFDSDQPGRVRIVVEEKFGNDQKGLIWGPIALPVEREYREGRLLRD
jgi:hypothetical protein